MDRQQAFEQERSKLFGIAYRMLGSPADAEDMVQECWLRWQAADAAGVRTPGAFLATVVTRLCLDHLRSAEVARKEYIGPWLPEPIATPADAGEIADSLSYAFLVMLQSLSPAERAVFLMREVFDYDYSEIAAALGTSEANCRKMLERAKMHAAAKRPRFTVSRDQHAALLGDFGRACASGDLDGLMLVLASNAALYSDGGGKAKAALNPIHGADRVARFMLGIMPKAPQGMVVDLAMLNGRPAFVSRVDGRVHSMLLIEPDDEGRIATVYIVANPDKLVGGVRPGKSKTTESPSAADDCE
ncbi:MAG: RNA polymerase sigma-70 factor [Bryobacteraceae bacterium]